MFKYLYIFLLFYITISASDKAVQQFNTQVGLSYGKNSHGDKIYHGGVGLDYNIYKYLGGSTSFNMTVEFDGYTYLDTDLFLRDSELGTLGINLGKGGYNRGLYHVHDKYITLFFDYYFDYFTLSGSSSYHNIKLIDINGNEVGTTQPKPNHSLYLAYYPIDNVRLSYRHRFYENYTYSSLYLAYQPSFLDETLSFHLNYNATDKDYSSLVFSLVYSFTGGINLKTRDREY